MREIRPRNRWHAPCLWLMLLKDTVMFTRILVPTDFSRSSDAALAHARRLAAPTGASLHVLHVADNVFLRTVLADPRNYEAAALWQLQEQFPDGAAGAILVVESSEAPADEIRDWSPGNSGELRVHGCRRRRLSCGIA